ncbi:receptor-like protein kinase 7 [Syzygium oleosum]|uniref:receptor-like protein kinase 7 n=1 Tax=Syzygium oleosum TaxID=219896 RepID=UPI0024BB37FE|nr:receptor-like protein kinase 7 [Syzygium oleosum]
MSASTGWRNLAPLFLLCFLCLFSSAVTADELHALLNLTTTLQTPNPDLFSSWTPNNPPCQFAGITCNVNGSVMEIDLSNQQLAGVLPLGSICELRNLEKLALGFNSLHGTPMGDLNDCVKLQYLDLGNNFFSGSVPDISSLRELRYLYLNKSGFSGAFPWSSLKNMADLIVLSVGDNPFDRTPFPEEIGSLLKLNVLYMTNCSIEGQISPVIGYLIELESLELSLNNLTGEIPKEIGNLVKLWRLELYGNSLTGKFPVGFRNLIKLEYLDASMNYLEGDLSELRSLTNIVSLQLFKNQFSGEVPMEFGEFQKLVNLSLYTNMFSGSLPQKLGSWAKFIYIDVSENFLEGTIPPEMCKQGTMTKLLVLQNSFSGEIPGAYANCSSLTRFRVSNNSLSGVVPAGIWGLPNVDVIDISLNQLEGPITSDIKNAKALTQLLVGNNRLSGKLPEEILEAELLVKIDLSYNQLSGRIPVSIGELKSLSSLYVQDNMLSGAIPESLGLCVSLSNLNMAHNSLSGKIPSSLGSLLTLNSLNLSDNELSGQIPASLSSLRLSLLDLSNNHLTGRIPQSLSLEAYNGSFSGNPSLCTATRIGSFKQCSSHPGTSKIIRTIVICFLIASVLLLTSLACFICIKNRDKDGDRKSREESWEVKSFHTLTFTEDEILDSIKHENLIGKGGSGNVYKAKLPSGQELAVKNIPKAESSTQRRNLSTSPMLGKGGKKSREFESEVRALSSIRHVNVVKLYCSITSEDWSLLVYEYLPNGSLWDRLHSSGKSELDWKTRYWIAVGAAKGLEYLHHGCERPMIHRDVKSSNILLDELMKPRIADFGLAKILQADRGVKDSTQVIAGTPGYIAPEYGYTSRINEKSDVYSFGVVLMELVTGKRSIEPEYGENMDIVSWVSSNLKCRESVMRLMDPRIVQDHTREQAIEVLRIAILCTERLPSLRPTMRRVVQMLEEAEPCGPVDIVVEKDGKFGVESGKG